MNAMMEQIFLLAGHAIKLIGFEMCILLIALMPVYLSLGFIYMRNVAVLNSRMAVLLVVFSVILSLLLSIIFGVSALGLGDWG